MGLRKRATRLPASPIWLRPVATGPTVRGGEGAW